jgi:hypothetical protein
LPDNRSAPAHFQQSSRLSGTDNLSPVFVPPNYRAFLGPANRAGNIEVYIGHIGEIVPFAIRFYADNRPAVPRRLFLSRMKKNSPSNARPHELNASPPRSCSVSVGLADLTPILGGGTNIVKVDWHREPVPLLGRSTLTEQNFFCQ